MGGRDPYNLLMPRIRGRTREQTRSDALQAASTTFGQHGFAGASLGTIAREAGVTAATLCHHFGGKQGLYDAATDAIYAELGTLPERIAPEADFNETVETVYLFATEHHDAIRFLLRRIMEEGGVDARVREVHMGPWLDVIDGLISARFGVSRARARITSVTLTHLIARFATNSPADNRLALMADDAQAQAIIIKLLCSTGRHLMGLTEETP